MWDVSLGGTEKGHAGTHPAPSASAEPGALLLRSSANGSHGLRLVQCSNPELERAEVLPSSIPRGLKTKDCKGSCESARVPPAALDMHHLGQGWRGQGGWQCAAVHQPLEHLHRQLQCIQ